MPCMLEKTTITVTDDTWKQLDRRKSRGQTMNDVVVSLLETENSADGLTDRISEGDR